jgi:FlaA1/EpsC-like NDP-sugar epimerase
MPSAPQEVKKAAMQIAVEAGLSVLTVPSSEDLLSGRVAVSRLRPVALEDLLKRDAVQLDACGLSDMLAGKTVLVTGAGGSIGAELVRQIAVFGPGLLVLYEHSEYALFRLEQKFRKRFPYVPIRPIVGDVKDEALLRRVFAETKPAYVFPAAAYKHVPLMEGENAWQAVKNNVAGPKAVAQAARVAGVEKMVFVSTDKAVNPVNVMGATKRLAEMLLANLAGKRQNDDHRTRFVCVRFGNVLGSNGSVIPTFEKQIAAGGPVTVTHPDIIRYFMLIPEAAQLVLQAAWMGQGGEVFVLDMGQPVKIIDLARDMIRLSGHTLEEIPIEITGLRPGEKLYEELLADGETTLPTPHSKLRIAQVAIASDTVWREKLDAWLAEDETVPTSDEVKQKLAEFVPEYRQST